MSDSDVQEQLLVAGADEAWGDIEHAAAAGGGRKAAPPAPDVSELLRQPPAEMLEFLRTRGVLKVATFEVEGDLILAAVGDETFLTLASESRELPDAEASWRRELRRRAASAGGGGGGGHARRRPGAAAPVDVAGWSRVTAEAFVVNVRDAAAPDVDGLVNPLLRRYQAGGLSFSTFALPAVQAILQYKWHKYARKLLLCEFLVYAVWLASFSVYAGVLWQDEDPHASLAQLLKTHAGRWTVALELLGSLCMLPFLAIEVGTIRAYGWSGWFGVWNALDTSTYVCQIAITFLHLSRIGADSGWLSIVVAFQSVALWVRLNYFSRLFGQNSFSFSFVDSLREVVADAAAYMAFLMLLLWGFALAFAVLFRREQEGFEQFSSVGRSLLTVFGFALGGVDLDVMTQSHNPRAALCLGLMLQFSVSILLMNLLTGMMCASFARATEHEDQRVLLSLATVVDEIEATLPPSVERALIGAFAARPPFIHVLRISPAGGASGASGSACAVAAAAAAAGRGGGSGSEDEDGGSEGGGGGAAAAGGGGWEVTRRGADQGGGGGRRGGGGQGGGMGEAEVAGLRRELAALRRQVQALHDTLSLAVPSLPPSPPQVQLPPPVKGGKRR